jgi:hypothetical protein
VLLCALEPNELSPDRLIEMLKTLSISIQVNTALRDQIILRLNRWHGLSLRHIAGLTGMDHTTVRNHIKDLEPAPTLTLPSYLESETPEQTLTVISATYGEAGPVRPKELTLMWDELQTLQRERSEPTYSERLPPDASWVTQSIESLLIRAREDLKALTPEQVVARYQQVLLAGRWRIENVGYDVEADRRVWWLEILGRLTVHSGP